MSTKLIETFYRNGCCERSEYWLIDTDAELADLPKAPPGSYAVSSQSGRTYYVESDGEWPSVGNTGGSGGGVSSWNDLTDKPFYETTVMGDTLTWDGNTDGLYSIADAFYKVSDAVPTLSDLQNGGTMTMNIGIEIPFTADNMINMKEQGRGENVIGVGDYIIIALEDGAWFDDSENGVLEKAGVYFINVDEGEGPVFISSFTINNYTGFETTEVKTIDPKYLPVDYIKQLITEVTGS